MTGDDRYIKAEAQARAMVAAGDRAAIVIVIDADGELMAAFAACKEEQPRVEVVVRAIHGAFLEVRRPDETTEVEILPIRTVEDL